MTKKKTAGDHLRYFRSRVTPHTSSPIWWLEIVLPLLLAGAMFASLTFLIYSGKRHTTLAAQGENSLIAWSLATQGMRVSDDVMVVSASERDLVPTIRLGIQDVDLFRVAEVINRLYKHGVVHIILNLQAAAHPSTAQAFQPLIDVLSKRPKNTTAIIAWPMNARTWTLPDELAAVSTFVDNGTCSGATDVQILCPFDPNWNDWAVQMAIQSTTEPHLDSFVLSTSLPSPFPSYLLHLPAASSLRRASFQSVLDGVFRGQKPPKVAFIGVDLPMAPEIKNHPYLMTRVHVPAEKNDVPYHVFWAQVASMFATGDHVKVPAEWVQWSHVVLVCLSVIALVVFVGGAPPVGLFLAYCLALPHLNRYVLVPMGWYIPMVNGFYFGLMTLLFAGFGRLSWEVWRRLALAARQRFHAQAADLKGNFISLLSHNLNTPVAKMQGMLDVLASTNRTSQHIQTALELNARISVIVKTILLTSAAEARSLHEYSRSAASLAEEFRASSSGLLRRMRMDIQVIADATATGIPIKLDTRLVLGSLVALCSLPMLRSPESAERLSIEMTFSDNDDGALVVKFKTDRQFSDFLQEVLTSNRGRHIRDLSGANFFMDVLATLILVVGDIYRGQWTFSAEECQWVLTPANLTS